MNANNEFQNAERIEIAGCCLGFPLRAYLWGAVLLLVGLGWLLITLGLVTAAWLQPLWPLLLVGIGLAYILSGLRRQR